MARTKENGLGSEVSHLALKTNLWRKRAKGQPASADYLRFCSKEKGPRRPSYYMEHEEIVKCLAAFQGYLPLLQELLKPLNTLDSDITGHAGESFSRSLLLLLCLHF